MTGGAAKKGELDLAAMKGGLLPLIAGGIELAKHCRTRQSTRKLSPAAGR